VKDSIDAEELQPIAVKGFDHPIRTYRVLGVHDEAEQRPGLFRHHAPGVKIDVDLKSLAAASRCETVQAIEMLLARLKDGSD
jgi:hypothetical protein